MTILDDYKQANPGSNFRESWDRFERLLDEETYFFAPKSYGARAQRTLQLIPENERLEKARQQITAYHHYFPLKKFVYWLFDIGDISAKRVWVAYNDLWKKPERLTFVEELNMFQKGFNALAPLLHRSWKKVIKSIGHFLFFLSKLENCERSEWRPKIRMKSDIEIVEWRRLSAQSKAAAKGDLIKVARTEAVLEEKQNISSSQAVLLRELNVLTFGSGLSSSTVDMVAQWVSPSHASQAGSKQLILSSDLSIIAPTGFNLSRDDDIRWAYVFICSFFAIDWTDLDKDVVQQNAKTSFNKNFALQLHPDKKPEFFINKDWNTRTYWENKVAEARKGEFDSAVEMREALLKILENNEVIDLKWRGDHQILLQAVKQGNELRNLTFRLVGSTERTAKADLRIEEYRREAEEYRREAEEYRREAEEHIRHAEEYERESDGLQKQIDELTERAEKRLARKERVLKRLVNILARHGHDMNSELTKEAVADPENFETILQNYLERKSQKLLRLDNKQTQPAICTNESVSNGQQIPVLLDAASPSEADQVPILPDTVSSCISDVSAKALIDRASTSGFLDKSTVDQAIQLEKEKVTLDQCPEDEKVFSANKSLLVRSPA